MKIVEGNNLEMTNEEIRLVELSKFRTLLRASSTRQNKSGENKSS